MNMTTPRVQFPAPPYSISLKSGRILPECALSVPSRAAYVPALAAHALRSLDAGDLAAVRALLETIARAVPSDGDGNPLERTSSDTKNPKPPRSSK